MTTTLPALKDWVDSVAAHTRPASVYWCDGSAEENDSLIAEMCESGILSPLNGESFPDCYSPLLIRRPCT